MYGSPFKNEVISEDIIPLANGKNINVNKTILSMLTNQENTNLQTWKSKYGAVYGLGMRPIINSTTYFQKVRDYLSSIVLQDLQNTLPFSSNKYYLLEHNGEEPINSFLEGIKYDLVNKLNIIFGNSCENIEIFKNFNPLNESFIITDINVVTYRSVSNENHYYHTFILSANNLTRYNTISFKGSAYQDTTPVMEDWNNLLNLVKTSKDIPFNLNQQKVTNIYISSLDFANNIDCVSGSEINCLVEPFDKNNTTNNNDVYGYSIDLSNYTGPENYENLVKDLKEYY